MTYAADLADIRAAAERIAAYAHRTPVMTCAAIDRMAGRCLFFKCENLQKVGAFKFRGACNAVMKLDDRTARRGVVTHSSGNHAQALALAAALRGIPAHVVMPATSAAVKRRAVIEYGGVVHDCKPTLQARETTAAQVVGETGGTFVPPYDHPDIIAGQGTAALELMEQAPGLEAIIAPIGGGGLMSGTCLAARGVDPQVMLLGAEPSGADDAARSLAAGRCLPQTNPRTICDGLLTSLAPDTTWPVLRDHLVGIETVDDDRTIQAMRLVWERMKLVIEPSAAVTVAAALTGGAHLDGRRRVGVIVSGGNVDLDRLPWT